MRKALIIFVAGLVGCLSCGAQTLLAGGIEAVIGRDRTLTGCNYTSYFALYDYLSGRDETTLSPTPEGYEAFYISTYSRHGSRFLTEKYQYDDVLNYLREGAKRKRLTPEGRRLLAAVSRVRQLCPDSRLGALTDIGREQHRMIAARMCEHFPEIFDARAHVVAQSSVVKRCVHSMNAQVGVIDSLTGLTIEQRSGWPGMQDRLAGHYTTPQTEALRNRGYAPHSSERERLTPYERLCRVVFTDASFLTVKKRQSFVRQFFDLCGNMQSHAFGIDFWDYFTPGEMDSLYTVKNRHWYRLLGPSPLTGGACVSRAKWQLQDILADADSVVERRTWHGGNLRFGHDTCLMPLACLMELGLCGMSIDEGQIDQLDRYWRNEEIFPMAGNIQLVFYRPTDGVGDVLVKALLCEREVSLPATPFMGSYYRWSDVRRRWAEMVERW